MMRPNAARWFLYPLAMALLAALLSAWPARHASAGQEAQQNQQQGQQEQSQEKSQQAKPKKQGGFFGGLKAVTGSGSEQTSATASAGTKGVGEGAKIGEVTPSAADRQAVTEMETLFVSPQELKKFEEDGHLKP
jgi:hypothetical protein